MENKIQFLIRKIMDKDEQEAFKYADEIAALGTEEAYQSTLELLKNGDWEVSYLAAKALAKMEQRNEALDILLEIIHERKSVTQAGELVEALEAFDLTGRFVDILRIYLYGNYKASVLAKEYLDHTEFDITPRTIKKAHKHWKHYQSNVKRDEAYEIKKTEVRAIFDDLEELFS